jgi:DNA-binding winged helix-turn-helix (wHTH) protein
MPPSDADTGTSRSPDFAIGEWTVMPSRNLVARGAEEVRLEPRVMDVLVYLASRAPQSVSKDELIEHVWKRAYVSDDVLSVTIYALRKALGDEARQPRYIETIPRRGYRVIAPVRFAVPASTWSRLRRETPSKYESYVDLVPNNWTKIRIEVRGEQARLYVHEQQQPTLIVNDVKSGLNRKRVVALWIGPGTVAHFRNLTVNPDPEKR